MKSFDILTEDGNQEVGGYIVGHLGIHKDNYWVITHLSSGKQITFGLDKLADAKLLAEEVQTIVDFELWDAESRTDLLKLRRAINGIRRRTWENLI